MSLWSDIGKQITLATGKPFGASAQRAISGGCINSAAIVEGSGQRYFVKLNRASQVDMFAAEAEGLGEIARAGALRVPLPICHGHTSDFAYLVLEYVEPGRAAPDSLEQMGRQLAQMHRCTAAQYGWHRDNTIGSTLQLNTPAVDWVGFWQRQRLGFQLDLAANNGYRGKLQRKGEQLLSNIGALFRNYTPKPSLLHGDLWSGNYMIDNQARPVIFDPAVYYGDREADVAMTELFGGFPTRFYDAYQQAYPLAPGYRLRKTLYNLYHVLNHLNLFGGGYRSQAEDMIDALLRAVR
jgi:protein-ribulosamine 3-kinase